MPPHVGHGLTATSLMLIPDEFSTLIALGSQTVWHVSQIAGSKGTELFCLGRANVRSRLVLSDWYVRRGPGRPEFRPGSWRRLGLSFLRAAVEVCSQPLQPRPRPRHGPGGDRRRQLAGGKGTIRAITQDQILLTLVPSAIAVIVAIFVPWFTFRFALKQSRIDSLHDQRAQLYIDLLTEANAEKEYFEYDIADDDMRKRMKSYRTDLRLPPMERARLGSRGTIFASRKVNGLFSKLQGQALVSTLVQPKNEAERIAARLPVLDAFNALEAQVRLEMGADEIESK